MRHSFAVLALAILAFAPLAAQEMVGPYKLVPALPRPGAIFDNERGGM